MEVAMPLRAPLASSLAIACGFCLSATAVAAPSVPEATISSTVGTGAKGCVESSKVVRFTISTQIGAYTTLSARVTLDGKLVDSRNYVVVTGVRNGVLPVARTFTSRINLKALHSGSHTLKLVGVVAQPLGRRTMAHASSVFVPPVPPSFRGTVTATKTILKCALVRPTFTG